MENFTMKIIFRQLKYLTRTGLTQTPLSLIKSEIEPKAIIFQALNKDIFDEMVTNSHSMLL